MEKSLQKIKPGRYLLAAVMAGVVFYDDEKGCLVQEMIKPLKSGEQEANALYFKHAITMGSSGRMGFARIDSGYPIKIKAQRCYVLLDCIITY